VFFGLKHSARQKNGLKTEKTLSDGIAAGFTAPIRQKTSSRTDGSRRDPANLALSQHLGEIREGLHCLPLRRALLHEPDDIREALMGTLSGILCW
jgi:hypothetical protein